MQTFEFNRKNGRNQATVTVKTPIELIQGSAEGIHGKVSFDPDNPANSLKGKLSLDVKSIETGSDITDNLIFNSSWLWAKNFPEINFTIEGLTDVKRENEQKISGIAIGKLTLRGVTREVTADFSATYIQENEFTRSIESGNLLGIRANLIIRLVDFGIRNEIIGKNAAGKLKIELSLVGSSSNNQKNKTFF
ncbi:MAG: YceI family protein [Ignavibacteriales bacterium]|nr:YceI family protein [Ignavibacteriales bacterium]